MEKTLKDYLAAECETAAARITPDNELDSLYYFSAVFGAAQRVFNIEMHPEVVHLYVVSNWAHSQLNARLQAEQQVPFVMTPKMPKGVLEKLAGLVKELAARIRQEQQFMDILTEMCRLAYAATGNGYYLQQVGRL